jgi:hypothetical protein
MKLDLDLNLDLNLTLLNLVFNQRSQVSASPRRIRERFHRRNDGSLLTLEHSLRNLLQSIPFRSSTQRARRYIHEDVVQ